MKSYTSPKITDHGDVRDITAGKVGFSRDDANKKAGESSFTNTTGACLNIPNIEGACHE